MDTTVFDGIARELGEVSSRRTFFRLLGGAAAVGAGLAGSRDGLAKGKGKNKKITICYQGQTRTAKKKTYQDKFPGATKGECPPGGGNPGGGQPQPCTTWIISGGPSQSDRILADDDIYIFRPSKGGASIINDPDKKASSLPAVVFEAQVGEVLNIVGYDAGGCRSLSPLWLHCVATGQKRQLFAGYSGANCSYGAGTFVNENVTVSL
jgi:hypothetical protein